MVLMRLMITVLFVGNIHQEVCARVCYYGQEPDSNHEYRWSLADKNPADCSEFRLGGLNVKPHRKPYEVVIGDDRNLINKDEIVLPIEEEHSDATCEFTTEGDWSLMWTVYTPGHFTMSPERLEFTVSHSSGPVSVDLYLYSFTRFLDPSYKIEFYKATTQTGYSVSLNQVTVVFTLEELQVATFTEWSRFWVTYIEGVIQVGQVGSEGVLLAHNVTRLDKWSIYLDSTERAEWQFYEPCEDQLEK